MQMLYIVYKSAILQQYSRKALLRTTTLRDLVVGSNTPWAAIGTGNDLEHIDHLWDLPIEAAS